MSSRKSSPDRLESIQPEESPPLSSAAPLVARFFWLNLPLEDPLEATAIHILQAAAAAQAATMATEPPQSLASLPPRLQVYVRHCAETGSTVAYEDYDPSQGGTWWFTSLHPIEIAAQPRQIVVAQFDITPYKRAIASLERQDSLFQSLIASESVIICRYILHPDGTTTWDYVSPGFAQLWEQEPCGWQQDPNRLWESIHPDDQTLLRQAQQEAAQSLAHHKVQWRIQTPSGQCKWLQAMGKFDRHPNGDRIWSGLLLDITEHKETELTLRESEARYRLVAENMTDLVGLHAPDGRYLYVSPSCRMLLGYEPEELIGQSPDDFVHPEDRDRILQTLQETSQSGQITPVTCRFRSHGGNYVWLETLTKPILDHQGHLLQLQTTSRVISDRIQAQEQLRYKTLHDDLTGLPNRNLLIERLELAIKRFQRNPKFRYAVLFLDLDRFKVINDSLGHLAGDQLLIDVSLKLQALTRDVDVAARLSGDEFVVLLEFIDTLRTAFRVAERIAEELQTPFWIGDREVCVTTSIGIVLGSSAHQQPSDLLRDADIAMYRAKAKGGGRYEIFSPIMHVHALERLNLENDLRKAIDQRNFVLYFQPIVSLITGTIVGLEALARWQHPQRGLISPQVFLPVAEETGLILPLSNWLLEQACQQMATWHHQFPHTQAVTLNFNLAGHQFREPKFVALLQDILTRTGLAGHCLVLELREAMLVSDMGSVIARLRELRSLTVQLSIDDFGIGYSSLNHLHRFPINILKIAQDLISSSQNDNQAIIQIIVTLARQLNLVVVAEGIETHAQHQQLLDLGCDLGQGYYFALPLSAAAIAPLLATNPPRQPFAVPIDYPDKG